MLPRFTNSLANLCHARKILWAYLIQLHALQLIFLGKSIDLLTVLVRLKAWARKHLAIPTMSQEEYRARNAIASKSGPSIGTDKSVV
jgi:hypothetical protein